MLQIKVPISPEGWDEKNEVFVDAETVTIQLEHSLVSISKWESRWHKPFLIKEEKSYEETMDYIKCMTLTPDIGDEVYEHMSNENMEQINKYIEDPMTATTFPNDNNRSRNREIVTSEVIYYWMISLQIPFECEHWPLKRLLTLIRVCNVKNAPTKKMSQRQIMSDNAALNAARRAKLNSKG